MINKDTQLFGSFSRFAGSRGCKFFNTAFAQLGINAIYKSFSVSDIARAVASARCLDFGGFAVSMPFKRTVLEYIDEVNEEVKIIGAANTIVNSRGTLKAYNTDYLAAQKVLVSTTQELYILGNGGYAAAVKHAATTLKKDFVIITRNNWNEIKKLKGKTIFNCTPVMDLEIHPSNEYIDCLIGTATGDLLASIQAKYQFELYTGIPYPEETL